MNPDGSDDGRAAVMTFQDEQGETVQLFIHTEQRALLQHMVAAFHDWEMDEGDYFVG